MKLELLLEKVQLEEKIKQEADSLRGHCLIPELVLQSLNTIGALNAKLDVLNKQINH